MKLKLADNLALPADEAVTQKYGFIGRSGSGKSYASMRLAELFLNAGAQVIALDWVGIWWSLRLASNGKDVGFPDVYIFGGEHADVDLRPESGALMADLVVDKHISVVLDVMHFRKAERTRFATAFAEQFFHRKKTARSACHLFIEEAQAYLPQMVRGDEARMVGVFEDIGKVGRNYGIGNSLISQRPQAINKDVLNQVEVLLAFQTNGPQERKAIAGWTTENTTAGAAMIQELPKLRVGDALVWSPQWLRIAEQVHISKRETYDASRTPQGAAKAIKPKTLAKADLEQLGEQIAATIEKAKADDPRELRKRIVELEVQLRKTSTSISSAPERQTTSTKPALTDQDRELLKGLAADFRQFVDAIADRADVTLNSIASRAKAEIDKACGEWTASVDKRRALFLEHLEKTRLQKVLDKVDQAAPSALSKPAHIVRTERTPAPRRAVSPVSRVSPASSNGNGNLGAPERRILDGLAWWEAAGIAHPSRHQTAFAARYSVNGHFNNIVGNLRVNGLVDYPKGDHVMLTEAGRAHAQAPESPADRNGLIGLVDSVLRQEPQRRLFKAMVDAGDGAELSREELAARCNYSVNGHFNNVVGSLKSLGIVRYPRGNHVALGEMFEGLP